MKHPFQKVLLNEKGDLLFAGAGQKLFVFQRRGNWELADSWVDTVDPNYALIKEYEARSRKFEQESAAGDCKPPKVPTPGPGAPPKLCYIRDIRLSRSEKYLILTTDTDKAVVVFELNGGGSLREIKRQPLPKRPCAVSTSLDDSTVVVGDKFGDVYCIDMLSSEVKDEKDMVPVLAHQAEPVPAELHHREMALRARRVCGVDRRAAVVPRQGAGERRRRSVPVLVAVAGGRACRQARSLCCGRAVSHGGAPGAVAVPERRRRPEGVHGVAAAGAAVAEQAGGAI
ncbi:hypothetical protein KL932_000278 [Ogataea haglerorum]|nr:hypothetical protein KL951_000488 [Ogataea haglerorum]KAG7712617.1 hypothetical protein KL950_000488 [Ogataea haglerorum]KAG7745248.1 hypothetical protein KL932_000278 [Ogataea haglerorum]KAG7761109.1 hypothetical protein KL947_000057 [Ogataea haglerorum]KAG7783862.1 hypothetical protein KL945_004799 [Ogataea haglerorum]